MRLLTGQPAHFNGVRISGNLPNVTIRSKLGVALHWVCLFGLWCALHACSRDYVEQVPSISEEDRQKVDLERAVEEIEAKLRQNPTDHLSLYRLGCAYERKTDWLKMADAFERASVLAPDHAKYFAKLGQARLALGRVGVPRQFELARISLQACRSKDANIAECHRDLGEAEEYSSNFRAALDSYTEAIVRDPTAAESYLALAQLYYALKLFAPAESVIRAGTSVWHETERTIDVVGELHLLESRLALVKHDRAGQISALEQAVRYGDAHPEYAFELGLACASAIPPRKDEATKWLTSFMRRCCRAGPGAERFARNCQLARDVLSSLRNATSQPDGG